MLMHQIAIAEKMQIKYIMKNSRILTDNRYESDIDLFI